MVAERDLVAGHGAGVWAALRLWHLVLRRRRCGLDILGFPDLWWQALRERRHRDDGDCARLVPTGPRGRACCRISAVAKQAIRRPARIVAAVARVRVLDRLRAAPWTRGGPGPHRFGSHGLA